MSYDLQNWLVDAGNILASGLVAVEDGAAFLDKVKAVLASGTDPTDADYDALHAYEKKELDILDAPMDGE